MNLRLVEPNKSEGNIAAPSKMRREFPPQSVIWSPLAAESLAILLEMLHISSISSTWR